MQTQSDEQRAPAQNEDRNHHHHVSKETKISSAESSGRNVGGVATRARDSSLHLTCRPTNSNENQDICDEKNDRWNDNDDNQFVNFVPLNGCAELKANGEDLSRRSKSVTIAPVLLS